MRLSASQHYHANQEIGTIHRQLILEVREYETCTVQKTQIFVKFTSPVAAKESFRSRVQLNDTEYLLENTDCHSTIFVCTDIQGTTTSALLEKLKTLIFLREGISLSVHRQHKNGPIIVIKFSAPLNLSGFTVLLDCSRLPEYAGHNAQFVQAQASCELCRESEHFIGDCDQFTEVLPLSRACKRFFELHYRGLDLRDSLEYECGEEVREEVEEYIKDCKGFIYRLETAIQ